MVRYEILMLAVPEITQDEAKELESSLDGIVRAAQGSVISFERWGKFRLAYPVRKNDYGVYFLMRFEAPLGTGATDAARSYFMIKAHEVVMRHVLCALDEDSSLAYQRPKSLEESPSTRDVKTFLKENKMEGLLASVEGRGGRRAGELEDGMDDETADMFEE